MAIDKRVQLSPNIFIPCIHVVLSLAIIYISCGPQKTREDYTKWNTYRGTKSANQYSALNQIDTSNVHDLQVAWTYNTGDHGDGSAIQCNPIIVDGVMYVTSPKLDVIALDAATGEEIWRFTPLSQNSIAGVNRGVTFWSKGDDSRILFTAGHYLIALDAEAGSLVTEFGDSGRVDLRYGLGPPPEQLSLSVTSPGVIYRELIIIGSATGEGYNASPGHVRAYSVVTGELEWIFHTLPKEGEPGYETWEWQEGEWYGAANVWGGLSIDEIRGWVFLATGSPSYDFYGASRIGANLFGNCIIALEASTGRYIWHYQVVRHDLWDYDLPCAPNLVTVRKNGRFLDVVVQPTKMGYLVVLERETGRPVYEMEEIPVSPSDVEGEVAWPTQPVPKTGFYTRQFMTESDLNRISPEFYEEAFEKWSQYRFEGRFTPPSLQGSLFMPGTWGGANWGGASADPNTSMLYVTANEIASISKLVKVPVRVGSLVEEEGSVEGLLTKGKELYLLNCTVCHGVDRKGIPPAYPSLNGISNRLSNEEISILLKEGKGVMPAYAFSQVENRALTTFLLNEEDEIEESENPVQGQTTRYVTAGYWKFLDDERGLPLSAPPWSSLNALDISSGKLIWKMPLGEVEELASLRISPTGNRSFGGCISTLGGLVFVGAATDEKFRAFHSRTGELLWEFTLPAGGYAVPSTYEISGRQYVVIAAGGGGRSGTPSGDAYIAFNLKSDD